MIPYRSCGSALYGLTESDAAARHDDQLAALAAAQDHHRRRRAGSFVGQPATGAPANARMMSPSFSPAASAGLDLSIVAARMPAPAATACARASARGSV